MSLPILVTPIILEHGPTRVNHQRTLASDLVLCITISRAQLQQRPHIGDTSGSTRTGNLGQECHRVSATARRTEQRVRSLIPEVFGVMLCGHGQRSTGLQKATEIYCLDMLNMMKWNYLWISTLHNLCFSESSFAKEFDVF